MTLTRFNVSLGGSLAGEAGVVRPNARCSTRFNWSCWTYMDSTRQLRNTRNPISTQRGGLGYPMCLALCKNPPAPHPTV